MHYYQFNIGDYRAATAHLSNEEDLAYRRLLDMYYDSESRIPLDIQWVSRRLRLEPHVVRDVLQDMFVKQDDGWSHAKCDEVIQHYHAMAEKNRTNGRLGGRKKNPMGIPVASESEPIAKATNNYKLETKNQDISICPPDGGPEAKDGLPDCQHKEVIELYHQHLPTLRKVEVWNAARQGYLRQRWREVAAELAAEKKTIGGADVLGWWADFFQHIGKSKFLTGKVNSRDGRAFVADLEWILRPSNFAKIIEGKYHGV
jgi:uncharacterized protein YdaU (DUF1376 family)